MENVLHHERCHGAKVERKPVSTAAPDKGAESTNTGSREDPPYVIGWDELGARVFEGRH
jgi:hypothetical protein